MVHVLGRRGRVRARLTKSQDSTAGPWWRSTVAAASDQCGIPPSGDCGRLQPGGGIMSLSLLLTPARVATPGFACGTADCCLKCCPCKPRPRRCKVAMPGSATAPKTRSSRWPARMPFATICKRCRWSCAPRIPCQHTIHPQELQDSAASGWLQQAVRLKNKSCWCRWGKG